MLQHRNRECRVKRVVPERQGLPDRDDVGRRTVKDFQMDHIGMGRFAQTGTGIQNEPVRPEPTPINPAARHFGAFDARCHAGRTRRTRDPAPDLLDRMRNP